MGKRSRRTRGAVETPGQDAGRDASGRANGMSRPSRIVLAAAAVGAGFAIIAISAAWALGGGASSGSAASADYSCLALLSNPAGVTDGEGFAVGEMSREHVELGTKATYASCPPTSGEHLNDVGLGPIQPGYYGPSSAASPLGWVHNLEHGYVAALYRCVDGTCPSDEELAVLRSFALAGSPGSSARCEGRPKIVVARFDEMSAPYGMVAWDRALMLDAFDPAIARDFAGRWIDETAPEKGEC